MSNDGTKKKFKSLATTLTVVMVALSSTLLLGFALLTTYTAAVIQQDALDERQAFMSKSAADTVNGYIQSKIDILEVAIKTGNVLSSEASEQENSLEKILGYEQSFTQLLLYRHDTGSSTHVSRFSDGDYAHFLDEIDANDLFTHTPDESRLSGVYIDAYTSEPHIVIAVPVVNVFGESHSSLFAEVNLKFMWDFMSQMEVGREGVAYVVDRSGRLIAFQDISRVLRGENVAHIDEVERYMDQWVGRHHNHTSLISKGISNTNVVTTHGDLELTEWGVIVEQPIRAAFRDLIKQARLQLTFLALGILLAAFTAILIARKISQPIIQLRDATQSIGEGKWDTNIQTTSRNEIGQLARSFNAMVRQLRSFYDDLEKKVEERSKELSTKITELETLNRLMVDREIRMIELKKKLKETEARECKK